MRNNTLKDLLVAHLKNNPGWHKKVHLFVLGDDWGYSPDTLSRKLREATEEELIQVSYYDGQKGQKLARYAYDKPVEKKPIYKIINGVCHVTYA